MSFKIIKKAIFYIKSKKKYFYIVFLILGILILSVLSYMKINNVEISSFINEIRKERNEDIDGKEKIDIDIEIFAIKDRVNIVSKDESIIYIGETESQIENGYFDISLKKLEEENKVEMCILKLWYGEYKKEYKNYINDNYLHKIIEALIKIKVIKDEEKQEVKQFLYNTYVDYVDRKEVLCNYKENKIEAKTIENILFIYFNIEED